MKQSPELITVKGLSYRYAKQLGKGCEPSWVLDNADFSLAMGERVALVGDNGAGKTTFLQLLLGLQKTQQGQIMAFGEHCQSEKDFQQVRSKVGFLFQDSDDQLFCPTVIEDVAFGPLNLGKTQHEALDISYQTLEKLGMADYAERVTHQLSGGEKRMIALASILSMQPQVLLLDEPSNALDKKARQRLIDTLLTLEQSMIVVSHDELILEEIANRWVKLEQGKLTSFKRHAVDI